MVQILSRLLLVLILLVHSVNSYRSSSKSMHSHKNITHDPQKVLFLQKYYFLCKFDQNVCFLFFSFFSFFAADETSTLIPNHIACTASLVFSWFFNASWNTHCKNVSQNSVLQKTQTSVLLSCISAGL